MLGKITHFYKIDHIFTFNVWIFTIPSMIFYTLGNPTHMTVFEQKVYIKEEKKRHLPLTFLKKKEAPTSHFLSLKTIFLEY
jgi:hypothetical protein